MPTPSRPKRQIVRSPANSSVRRSFTSSRILTSKSPLFRLLHACVERNREEAPDEVLGEYDAIAGQGDKSEGVQGDEVQFAELAHLRRPLGESAREGCGLERDPVEIVEEQRRAGRDQRSGNALFLLLARSAGGDGVRLAPERNFANAAHQKSFAHASA